MKAKAAVAFEKGQPLELAEVDLDGPRAGEVMVELLETGRHEQENVGQASAIAAALSPNQTPEIGMEAAKICLTESARMMTFCGIRVPFGPISHTWTNVSLAAIRPLGNKLTELEWKGSAKSTYWVEYKRPESETDQDK